jgi:small conductance mechanosensitive channel
VPIAAVGLALALLTGAAHAAPVAPGLPASSPSAAAAAATPRPLEPLLPNSGLLEGGTWLALGQRLLTRVVDALPGIFTACLVLAFFVLASRLVARVLRRILGGSHVDPGLRDILVPLGRYVVLGLGIIMALSQAGLQVGSLLAGVGVVGLAVGLAAQDTLGNMLAGFSILWDRPFRIGDRVTIAGTYGQVTSIGLRSTRMKTVDATDVILPNKSVLEQMIINHTGSPGLRLAVPLSIGYKEDIRHAREVLVAAVKGHPMTLAEPPPEVVVVALGDSAVQLQLRVWLRDPQAERASLFALLEVSKLALDAAGIEIPFPHRTVRIAAGSPDLQVRVAGPDDRELAGDREPPALR